MAMCDLSKYDIVVQYSMANVRNFELSGLFPSSILKKMVYIPVIEYEYSPFHLQRNMAPITTFNDATQPRRKDLIQRLRKRGIHIINLAKTWEKLMIAARIIAAVPNPADVLVS
jgi:hypothetical protein